MKTDYLLGQAAVSAVIGWLAAKLGLLFWPLVILLILMVIDYITANPAMNGTASPGNSTSWSRGNHVHPTDTSRAAQTALDTYVRPNMLDNWDWRSPINSRGLTTYTGVSNYSINRWYIANNTITVSVETGGLKFTGSASMPSGYRLFEQIMNWYYNSGTKVTISARVISCSGTFRIMFDQGQRLPCAQWHQGDGRAEDRAGRSHRSGDRTAPAL